MPKRKLEKKSEGDGPAKQKLKVEAVDLESDPEDLDTQPSLEDDLKKLGKAFRFQGKSVFLTYSQIPEAAANKQLVLNHINSIKQLSKWCIGVERHQDKGWHIHFFGSWPTKFDTTNCRAFDWTVEGKVLHPNIKTVGKKDAQMRVACYCLKDGDWVMEGFNWFETWDGFVRKERDMKEWLAWTKSKQVKAVKWPINLEFKNGRKVVIQEPKEYNKKCSYIICGEPDMFKSTTVGKTLQGQKVLSVARSDYPFENYNNERVIVYNDVIPALGDVVAASEYEYLDVPIAKCRYKNIYWEKEVRRVQIILCNPDAIPVWVSNSKVQARFNEVNLINDESLESLRVKNVPKTFY